MKKYFTHTDPALVPGEKRSNSPIIENPKCYCYQGDVCIYIYLNEIEIEIYILF